MFEAIAKRQLEKEVADLVLTRGAAWCFRYQSVQSYLLEKHPKQDVNILALCRVVATGAIAYLISLPELNGDQEVLISIAQRIQRGSSSEQDVIWAVQCWATALAVLPHQERVEIMTQLKAQAEAAKVGRPRVQPAAGQRYGVEAAAENRQPTQNDLYGQVQEAMREAATERQEAAVKRQRDSAEAEAKRHEPLIERWLLAFPREAAAIEEAATLAVQAQIRAETAKLKDAWRQEDWSGPRVMGSNFRQPTPKEKARAEVVERLEQGGAGRSRSAVDAEILRRIKTTPDQEELHRKMDAAWRAELQRRQAEEERENEMDAAWLRHQAEEERQQLQQKAAEEKRVKIEEWRKKFPIQCAGLDDEEVLRQIEAAPSPRLL